MPLIRPGIRRLFSLAVRRSATCKADVDDEVALHLELREQQLLAAGYSTEDARIEAMRRFGSTITAREQLRAAARNRDRTVTLREQWDFLAQDTRYALRGLLRERWFTAFIAITLGLGIGVNGAMYGVVDRLLLRGPLYLQDADRLQNIYVAQQADGMAPDTTKYFGYVAYKTLREHASRMRVATFKQTTGGTLYGSGPDAQRWSTADATPGLFPLLGVTPLLGRFFTDDEDQPSPSQFVVVLGYNVWKREFNSDPAIVGKSITLSDKSYTIIGVARKGFTGPQLAPVDVWFPSIVRGSARSNTWTTNWNWWGLHVIARLEPGVTPAQAEVEATTAYRNAYAGNQAHMKKATLLFRPISYGMKGSEPAENRISIWLVGVSVIVLLVACSNVTNLLLARAVRRRREVAVRLALGVSRARLLRLFLIESLLLSGSGAVAGLGVAFATGTFMRKTLLPDIEWSASTLDARVIFVLLGVTLAVAMTIGLLPAWGSNRTNLGNALKSGVRDGGGNRSRIRTTLAVAQTALSVILLVGAGLFVKSLYNVRGIDLGVETSKVVNTSIRWAPRVATASKDEREAETQRRAALYPQLLERVQKLPEVLEASLTVGLAFEAVMSYSIRVPGWDSLPKISSGAPSVSAVSANYFRTTGTRILRGRAFTTADRKGSEAVVIVSQTMARTLWPRQDALGSCFYVSSDSLAPCARIVGISADVHRFELREDPSMHFYLPWGQGLGTSATTLLIRPRGDEAAAIAAVRRAVQELDPTVSYVSARSLQESIEPQVRPWKLGANIFALMGVLAICVAAVGLYSVMSYFVAQRRQEIGVRMALGAQGSDILQLIMRSGVATAAIGIALGVVVSLAAGRFIEPLLFETSSRDTLVFAVVVSSLLGVSVLASLMPALRARRVNLLEALRTE